MKIFGIGLSKTGTTSLAAALNLLGYRVKDNPGIENYSPGHLFASIDQSLLEQYDAFTDTPIPSFYKELDKAYPGSKFILTIRETEGWLKSCKKQFTQKLADKQNEAHNQLFMNLYDSTVFDEERFKQGYDDFVNGVLDYFKERPDDLLVLNVSGGEDWEKLCPFLGKATPNTPFPKSNVTSIQWMKPDDVVLIAESAGREISRLFHATKNAGIINSLIYRLRYAKESPSSIAEQLSNRMIKEQLTRLTPEIPIISRIDSHPPNIERCNWNHYWVIDPLEGSRDNEQDTSKITVNIALIENGKPILGIVHAPFPGITYYAMKGKEAFKSSHGRAPIKLPIQDNINFTDTIHNSNTLSLCLLAENTNPPPSAFKNISIWQAAAAHAILESSGFRVTSNQGKAIIDYNPEILDKYTVSIKAVEPGQ